MIDFAFKFICCSGVFYLFYHFLLQQDTLFQRNRLFLMITLVISLILPFVQFSFQENIGTQSSLSYQILETLYISGTQAESAFTLLVWNLAWYDMIWYLASVFLGIRLLWKVGKILQFSKQFQSEKQQGHTLIYTNGQLPTFSFMGLLFWNNALEMDELSKKSVLAHELIHIKQKHSWDLFFVQFLKVIFWMNPFLYFYHKALKEQHEYIADAAATRHIPKQDYQHALVSVLFKNLNLGFVHNFNQSQIKKRIQKMNQMKTSKTGNLKVLWAIPMIICLLLTFSTKKVIAQSSNGTVYEEADQMAAPNGGMTALIKGLQHSLKYPKAAKKNGVVGKVYLSFIVNKDGSVSEVKVKKGLGHGCDEAAVKAIENLDLTWKPAMKDGKVVRQRLTLPVNFAL